MTCQHPSFGARRPVDSTLTNITPGTGNGIPITIIDTGAATPGVTGDRFQCYLHGTAVASVIHTIAPGAPLHSLSHSADPTRAEGTVTNLITALDHAGKTSKLINISMVTCYDTVELREAIARVQQAGALVIASTGNTGQCDTNQIPYPAALPGVLAVGAVDSLEHSTPEAGKLPASYSAGSEYADIFAPGGPVTAELEVSPGNVRTVVGSPQPFIGTSFAAPIVTATAARVWEVLPGAPAMLIRDILVKSAVPGGAYAQGTQPIKVLDSQAAINMALNIAAGSTGVHYTGSAMPPAVTTPLGNPIEKNYSVPIIIVLVFALVLVAVIVRRAMDSLKSPASGNPAINLQGTSTGFSNPRAFSSGRLPTE